jgi:GTP cyclohydrolase I
MKEIVLKEKDIRQLCEDLFQRMRPWLSKQSDRKVWGVPRGGIPVAYRIASIINGTVVDDLADANIIVDDIICTGRTREQIAKLLSKEVLERGGVDYNSVYPDSIYFDALIANPGEGEWYVFPWEGSRLGSIEDVPLRMIEYIGEDPKRDGLLETPKRIVKSWDFLFGGYKTDVAAIFKKFDNDGQYDQMVILKDIEFYSMCEHHALPFLGKVHIAYLPGDKIVGVSKLARVVEAFARRLQVQERLTEQIASAIEENLQPKGVAVYIEAQHLCMVARGVQKQNSVMVTSALKGCFRNDESRMEFLLLSRR